MRKAGKDEPLRFVHPSLSRERCSTCNEVTLHRYDRCIHCKTELPHAENYRLTNLYRKLLTTPKK